jgi:hypothetical protein
MTNAINSFAHAIATHPAISGAIAAWLIGNIAAALPSPGASSGKLYKFFFAFMHSVGGSIPRLGATLFPQYAKYFGASAIADTHNPDQRSHVAQA